MKKGIYTYYKERLIEIGGRNKCLYLRSIVRKSSYDVGRLLMGRERRIEEFKRFLWSSERPPFTLIGPRLKKELLENLESSGIAAIDGEIAKIKEIKREAEEIERETGKYELYIGYPFVLGAIRHGPQKMLIKAPLLLFPVKIELPDENTVELRVNEAEKIQINRALVFAYAQARRLDIDALNLDFDDLSQFDSPSDVIRYLAEARIRLSGNDTKNILSYNFNEPRLSDELTVHSAAVLGRFPLANSIYNDYTLLERQKLTNGAIVELLRNGKQERNKKTKVRKRRAPQLSYPVKDLDFAQEGVLRRVGESGNMVIYGPPGTGKSQTIVNIITDAISKNKRVLVVSQKKAALDVVYNRLGALAKKAMYLTDEGKQKQGFYARCLAAHQDCLEPRRADLSAQENAYLALQKKIKQQTAELDAIDRLLNSVRPFGLSLARMYSSSPLLSKNSWEYEVYAQLTESRDLLALNFAELTEAIDNIRAKELSTTYYGFLQDKEKNPIIDHLREGLDINTVSLASDKLASKARARKAFLNLTKYPYYRQVLAYYYELKREKNVSAIVDLEYRLAGKRTFLSAKAKNTIREQYAETLRAMDDFAAEYDFLRTVLDDDGYLSVIDNLLRGNTSYLRYVSEALGKYIALRDINTLFEKLDPHMTAVLNFAYNASKNLNNYLEIVDMIPQIRMYHELLKYEDECKEQFAKLVDFPNICARIAHLKEQELAIASDLCDGRSAKEYAALFAAAANRDDFFYQISKTQKFWPIRKMAEVYGDLILKLFPCWLLSPENVSNLLPLTKDLFDLVIFDEASQVFIENTIPAIYRGKSIVVAGDAKQLRPSTIFMRRYLGADPAEAQDDYSVQAALEVDSLLDLAVARYESANLTYHYRSRHSELIDFSNNAFYDGHLQIVPNLSKNIHDRPIIRYKVPGKWIDRKNRAEADKVVELLKEIFLTRPHRESVGIITFNADQQTCIADAIDRAAARDPSFRSDLLRETQRVENGEDISLFVKNLENVQGDERDIIIFSIGYAENEQKKLYTNFGSLSAEGGENRLNVAITRAKTKVIVVTSIEPEDLKIDTAKNEGPRLLKKYLQYVRAVSAGRDADARVLLAELGTKEKAEKPLTAAAPVEVQLRERLQKLGYTVDLHLGNRNNRISLAIYDEELDRYLVGVELDTDAFAASASPIERDVTKPRFLESRGWTILRVFCRDFWISPQAVVKRIAQTADKNKKDLLVKQAIRR